jgi:hypothetical protein
MCIKGSKPIFKNLNLQDFIWKKKGVKETKEVKKKDIEEDIVHSQIQTNG